MKYKAMIGYARITDIWDSYWQITSCFPNDHNRQVHPMDPEWHLDLRWGAAFLHSTKVSPQVTTIENQEKD